jgi:cytochrome c553
LKTALAAVLALAAAAPALAQDIAQRAEACFACHGKNGRSQVPLTPSLGGQPAFFVTAQLFLFRDQRRGDAPAAMYEAARQLSNDDLRAFGELVAKLPPPPAPAGAPDAARFARGRALAQRERCPVCHNPDLSGREQMPRLANQREDYLLKALRDYKRGTRIGYGAAMAVELAGLSDADLVDLAHFLAYFPGAGDARPVESRRPAER